MADIEKVYVYEHWRGENPDNIGVIYVDGMKGKEIISFEFDEEWLNGLNDGFVFDPDISYFRGRQYAPLDKPMFGVFADSCPDRWGRLLMKRREAILAKK